MAIIKAKHTEDYLSRRRSFGVYVFSVIGGVAAGFLTASLVGGVFNYQVIATIVVALIIMGISLLEIGKLIFPREIIEDSGLIGLVLITDSGISIQGINPSNFLVDSSIFTKRIEEEGNKAIDINSCRKRIFEICGLAFIKFIIWSYPVWWSPLETRKYDGMKIHSYKQDAPKSLLTAATVASELESFSSIFKRAETILSESTGKTFVVPKGTRVKVDHSSDFYLKILLYNMDYRLSLRFQIPTIQTGLNKNYEEYVSRHVDFKDISKHEYNKIFLSSNVEVILEASFPWFKSMMTNTADVHDWIENFKIRYFEYMGIDD